MYSRRVTAAAVEDFNRAQHALRAQGGEAAKLAQAELEYHSQAQIDHAVAHFAGLFDEEANEYLRPLRPDEVAFIQNERVLCKLDYRYWSEGYATIIDWRQQRSRFVPNVAQNIIRDIWGEMEEAGHAIWMQQLKARRLGVSTETEMAILHRFQFWENTAAVVAAATPQNSVTMAGMMKFAFLNQPWWLRPKPTKHKDFLPVEFDELHSALSVQAGNQFNGVARGATPTCVHLTELCEWEHAHLLVDAALMRAIIDHPGIFGVMESTALGTGNWWHATWEKNKREHASGRARVRPVFLPWYVGTDIYPSPAALHARPIPADWIPNDRTINHAERARQYVLNNPLLRQHLAKNSNFWQMPRAQMWYYELEYENARAAKELNLFLGEMASDDFSCFQSTNIPVIDQEILMNYHERTREPLAVFGIAGPDIPESLVPPRRLWDPNMPIINIDSREVLQGTWQGVYQLIPLIYDNDRFDPNGVLQVWEFPDDDYTYGVGTDTSGGTGNDNAVNEVLREATPERPPGQVAEWVHDKLTAFQMWPISMAINLWYSTYSSALGRRRQARAAIECMGTGEVVQHEMQKRGWSNFHPWKRYDDKVTRPDGEVRKIGIYTNVWFRPQMIDMVITHLDEESIEIFSRYLLHELTTLEREPGVQKIKAAYGAHDDRVFALGFPLYSLHMGKPPAKQFARKRLAHQGPDMAPPPKYPVWSPPAQASSRPYQPAQRLIPGRYRDQGGLVRYVNPRLPRGFQ